MVTKIFAEILKERIIALNYVDSKGDMILMKSLIKKQQKLLEEITHHQKIIAEKKKLVREIEREIKKEKEKERVKKNEEIISRLEKASGGVLTDENLNQIIRVISQNDDSR